MPDTTQPSSTQPTKKKKIKVFRAVNGVEQEVEIEVDDTVGPSWGPNDGHRLLNKSIRRVDAPVKVTGHAKYAYDAKPAGMLFGRVLRSPHAHARVTGVDQTEARKIDGVKIILELTRDVMHEGTPVVGVAAITPEIADDAIHALVVNYEVLPHVVKPEDAIKPESPAVFPKDAKVINNTRFAERSGNSNQVDDDLAKADAVVEAEYRTPTIHHACLETHGLTVDFNGGDSATVYATSQGTHTIPGDAARTLKLKRSNVVAINEYMGGGFGSKFGTGREGTIGLQLSLAAKAPVKLMLNRQDEFLSAGNRSASWQKLKAGASKDGTLLAIRATQYRLGGLGGGAQAGQPYQYKAQSYFREVSSIHTHIDSSRSMRAPGHPQASFAMESLMDELAYKIGMDPVEFRKKNLGDDVHKSQLDRCAKLIGWDRRNPTPGAGTGPLRRGMGCAVGAWGGGGGPQCQVDVTISKDGSIVAAVGSQDLGTGTRTYIRAIVAEELGLNTDDVLEKIGNSTLGMANSSGGSTTTASLAPAVKDAAFNARTAMAARVAPLLECTPDEVKFADGKVTGKNKSLDWKQACAALPAAGLSAHGEWKPGLSAGGVYGVCFAEVEVDIETGHIRPIKMVHLQDVGLPLNRLALESQINGGMIQGLGMALYEGRVMDAELGIMMNPGFGDYKLPGCLEMPELVAVIDDEDKREAVIGVAEPAIVPAAGAIANAVFNACGVRVRDLPITPDKILMGLLQTA